VAGTLTHSPGAAVSVVSSLSYEVQAQGLRPWLCTSLEHRRNPNRQPAKEEVLYWFWQHWFDWGLAVS